MGDAGEHDLIGFAKGGPILAEGGEFEVWHE